MMWVPFILGIFVGMAIMTGIDVVLMEKWRREDEEETDYDDYDLLDHSDDDCSSVESDE
jgi:hypothetical protein